MASRDVGNTDITKIDTVRVLELDIDMFAMAWSDQRSKYDTTEEQKEFAAQCNLKLASRRLLEWIWERIKTHGNYDVVVFSTHRRISVHPEQMQKLLNFLITGYIEPGYIKRESNHVFTTATFTENFAKLAKFDKNTKIFVSQPHDQKLGLGEGFKQFTLPYEKKIEDRLAKFERLPTYLELFPDCKQLPPEFDSTTKNHQDLQIIAHVQKLFPGKRIEIEIDGGDDCLDLCVYRAYLPVPPNVVINSFHMVSYPAVYDETSITLIPKFLGEVTAADNFYQAQADRLQLHYDMVWHLEKNAIQLPDDAIKIVKNSVLNYLDDPDYVLNNYLIEEAKSFLQKKKHKEAKEVTSTSSSNNSLDQRNENSGKALVAIAKRRNSKTGIVPLLSNLTLDSNLTSDSNAIKPAGGS